MSKRLQLLMRVGVAVGCLALALAATASAGKINKEDFARFVNCPIEQGRACLYAETLKGEFKLGNKSVPISTPVILQGGIAANGFNEYPLLSPRFGVPPLSKSPQEVPGGLTGISSSVGGPVYATAELAGTPIIDPVALGFAAPKSTAVYLPFKVHLENEELGPNCYIGSNEEPIVLKLTTAKTQPPEGTEPIEGSVGTNEGLDKGDILAFYGMRLVDNAFSAPAAKNCGTSSLTEPIITAAVNAAEGLPSAAGKNVAIMEGNSFESFSTYVTKYDHKAIVAKEKAEKPKK